ncbi:Gfo/Idh/MocA family protein [Paractinoplanes durhamensis]|uniref:Oxidoreductase n=1 Tax=Paractinoplanes durhamensis TaxID=113563 RepID=A0ABQ3Z2U3_9ACTN|nr:Gfo/Idh/MocA family oxidoreductase [Actinoplanes durhamensis]GIE04140.1 oxidoreductase [Actinoplanes durhamensis]
MGRPHRVGIVGTGFISAAYLGTLAGHPGVTIAAVADIDAARAATVAAGLAGCRALPVDELLQDPQVDTVLNLTVPAAHGPVALAAIANHKQVYGEKPLAADMTAARALLDQAAAFDVAVGCAPDTVLGTGIQTARAAVDDGLIGRPLSAVAVMATPGHERWHPNPDFYYLPGGGPLLDMGPYYLSALIHLLGPIVAVTGAASRLRDSRVIGSGPRAGSPVPVEVDTHVTGVLHHAGGVLSTITTSFDAVRTTAAPIEVHGETGTLAVPDPNHFDGDVRLFALGADDWRTLEPSAGYQGAGRGIGLLDMITTGAPRASGALALHVLDAMTSLLRSAAEGRRIDLTTTADRPPVVPFTPASGWRS